VGGTVEILGVADDYNQIVVEGFNRTVLVVLQLGRHCTKVHGLFDDFRLSGDVQGDRIDRSQEAKSVLGFLGLCQLLEKESLLRIRDPGGNRVRITLEYCVRDVLRLFHMVYGSDA